LRSAIEPMNDALISQIEETLAGHYPEAVIEIVDESWKHQGHAGAREHGGRHINLRIVSNLFNELSLLQRHRQVQKLLEKHFESKEIHALKLSLLTNQEESGHV